MACDSLTEEDLFQVLIQSENSLIDQYKASFKHYGIKLKFTEGALRLLSQKAQKQQTGARGLVSVFEELLRAFKFELPSTKIKNLEVNEELVRNPQGVLCHLLEGK